MLTNKVISEQSDVKISRMLKYELFIQKKVLSKKIFFNIIIALSNNSWIMYLHVNINIKSQTKYIFYETNFVNNSLLIFFELSYFVYTLL